MQLIDFILHIDVHLQAMIGHYGHAIYVILFAIIFIETWFIFVPFLPGDSLLFAAWSFAAVWDLNIYTIWISLMIAAILWDNLNYLIGMTFWQRLTLIRIKWRQLIKPEYLKRTEDFFAKHWERAIILARFVPIIRTCTPFVAGIWSMSYKKFLLYDIIGWVLRVSLMSFAWYFFGQQPWVKSNFEKVILLIIIISILPLIVHALRRKKPKNHATKNQK